MFWLVILSAVMLATASADFTVGCRNCICDTEGCEPYVGECYWDVYSDSCGPFAIKIEYWCDSNYIDPDSCTVAAYDSEWRDCTMQMACSERTIDAYMDRYGTYCTGGSTPSCEDYARIHNGGPNGCNSGSTDGYWDKVSQCCNDNGGC